jgi:hypothetical protein
MQYLNKPCLCVSVSKANSIAARMKTALPV